MRLARVLGAVGRTCIAVGVLILLFVAYQLWGTGIREAQAQDRLEEDFEVALSEVDPSTTSTTTTAPGQVAPPSTAAPIDAPADGQPVAHLRIPAIGVDKIVVSGVSLQNLKDGPGHYPETPLPGQEGNAAIAGHRTTYGAPFNRIDELEAGDEMTVETIQGSFRYLVREQLIVAPTQVEVLADKGDDRLTLTACHPKYSARERIVVVAELALDQVALPRPPPPEGQEAEASPEALDDLDGTDASARPAILYGLLCALIWALAWAIGRSWRRWPTYLLGLPLFLVALFFFFEALNRLLPSNY
jgi:sortase A